MSVGFHVFEHLLDAPVGADDERRAEDTLAGLLLAPDAEGVRYSVTDVGKQREVERELVAKCLMTRDVVGADAEHVRFGLEFAARVAELLALDGAPWSVVFRIEKQDDR